MGISTYSNGGALFLRVPAFPHAAFRLFPDGPGLDRGFAGTARASVPIAPGLGSNRGPRPRRLGSMAGPTSSVFYSQCFTLSYVHVFTVWIQSFARRCRAFHPGHL